MILDRDIWVDRTLTLLAEPHSEGSFLLARKGCFMHDDRAKTLGILGVNGSTTVEAKAGVPSTTPSSTTPMQHPISKQTKRPHTKAIHASENKMIRSAENKVFDENDNGTAFGEKDKLMIDLETLDDLE